MYQEPDRVTILKNQIESRLSDFQSELFGHAVQQSDALRAHIDKTLAEYVKFYASSQYVSKKSYREGIRLAIVLSVLAAIVIDAVHLLVHH
jgi:hypothetical protein